MAEKLSTFGGYPNPNIDPRDKGYDWILQYAQAAYRDNRGFMPYGQVNTGNLKMSEIKYYAAGKQPTDKYKKSLSIGDPADQSWRAIDWTPPAFMCKYREIGIAKILQRKFGIGAYAVDPIARSEEDAYFNKMKVKILMREEAIKAGSDLADSPVLAPQPGEPEDMEQLLMQQEFGYKHAMAMEAEQAIELINGQNNAEEIRKQLAADLYDFGIGATTTFLDPNGMVKIRRINPEYIGLSYCENPDFSDMIHWYELTPTYVGDLAPYYTKDQLDKICEKVLGKNGNPTTFSPIPGFFNQSWMRFKVMVMNIKFLSWNSTTYEERIDKRGNVFFGKTDWKNGMAVNKSGVLEENKGGEYPKYINSTKKVVYKASWVVDTEFMHNYGLQENQNRKLSSWWDTDLDIQIYAWNFYKMNFTGITERLIPFEDRACELWFNLQNLSNKLIPYLINIDFNAVESVNFGKGGNKQTPSQIIDFIFSNFVVPYRSTDLLSRNPNYKPISIEATGQLAAFSVLHDQLDRVLMNMQMVSGLNEATDASTVNAKNLNSTNEAMVQSTNNALFLISEADKYIQLKIADSIVQKVQIAVKMGKVQGYAKALGESTVKFFSINPDIALHELGIFIEEVPTDAQRQALWADLNMKESQGLITVADKYFIMTSRNLKQATMVLDYKIQKRKEQAQQFELQKIQENTQGQQQTAAMVEQLKQQTLQMQAELDMQKIILEQKLIYEIEYMKKQVDLQAQTVQADGRNIGHHIQGQAKIEAQKIASDAVLSSKHLQSVADLTMTHMDNETAKKTAKSK